MSKNTDTSTNGTYQTVECPECEREIPKNAIEPVTDGMYRRFVCSECATDIRKKNADT